MKPKIPQFQQAGPYNIQFTTLQSMTPKFLNHTLLNYVVSSYEIFHYTLWMNFSFRPGILYTLTTSPFFI